MECHGPHGERRSVQIEPRSAGTRPPFWRRRDSELLAQYAELGTHGLDLQQGIWDKARHHTAPCAPQKANERRVTSPCTKSVATSVCRAEPCAAECGGVLHARRLGGVPRWRYLLSRYTRGVRAVPLRACRVSPVHCSCTAAPMRPEGSGVCGPTLS